MHHCVQKLQTFDPMQKLCGLSFPFFAATLGVLPVDDSTADSGEDSSISTAQAAIAANSICEFSQLLAGPVAFILDSFFNNLRPHLCHCFANVTQSTTVLL